MITLTGTIADCFFESPNILCRVDQFHKDNETTRSHCRAVAFKLIIYKIKR